MRRPSPRTVLGLVAAGLAALLVVLGIVNRPSREPPPPIPPPPNRIVPDQFVARLSTEALGRAPDERAWSDATSYFRAHGCTAGSLAGYARAVYLGDEYDGIGYDATERTLTLYEGLLAREPDEGGFQGVVAGLRRNGPGSWRDVVDAFVRSPEFAERLAPAICAPDSPAYGPVATTAPIDVGAGAAGFTGDQAALQARLDATPPGGTVGLAPRAVVRISAPLRVPRGVTLATAGSPPVARYARMARLVRTASPADERNAAVVELADGARLSHVWVSGGRAWLGAPSAAAVSVRMQGDAATVEASKIADPLGGSGVFVSGPHFGDACRTATVRDNLVTGYGTEHRSGRFADGMSVGCPRTAVTGNAIVDATDVAIVVYRADGTDQASTVVGNRIVAAGRSAFAALAADPLLGAGGREFSFRGASFRANELWTGARTHFDIGLAAGSRAWFAQASDKGVGASFTANTTGSLAIRTAHPIAVDGMVEATVTGNALRARPMEPTGCPRGSAASLRDGWASGSIQAPVRDASLAGCIKAGP